MAREKLVIIGNGMAHGRMLEHLFERAPDAYNVTIFNAEPRVNYDRILLSPVLAGEKSFDEIVIHGDGWYIRHGVVLYKGHRIVEIDRAAKTVRSEHGQAAPYDKLVIATGSVPVVIPVPGSDLAGALTYRDLDDVNAMMLAARSRGHAVIIGGGLLGLEAAAGLMEQGMTVAVVHLMPTLMERQLDPTAGYLLQRELERRGMRIITQANTTAILGEGRVRAVQLADGTEIACDLVILAAGIRPNTGLALAAGLKVNRGIVADTRMQTSDPDILALGECAEVGAPATGSWHRSTRWRTWRRRIWRVRPKPGSQTRRPRRASRSTASISIPPAISARGKAARKSSCAMPRPASTNASCSRTTASLARCSTATRQMARGSSTF